MWQTFEQLDSSGIPRRNPGVQRRTWNVRPPLDQMKRRIFMRKIKQWLSLLLSAALLAGLLAAPAAAAGKPYIR